jgi:glycosyltransferase involved in cell wall biosynthesis
MEKNEMTRNLAHEKLTVLHVATPSQPITSDLGYGPIETIIYNIDKGLHSLGHRSIVACSGDSRVAGEKYVTVDHSIGDYWSDDSPERRKTVNLHLSRALGRAKMGDIDVIHMHDARAVEFFYDSMFEMQIPAVFTLHVQAEDSMLQGAYQRWCNPLSSPLVYCASISEYQKRQYHDLLNTSNVVYHGIDLSEFPVKEAPDKDNYLFTIGRITRAKGQDKAIETAKRTGSKLFIAGCVQNKPADCEYFASFKDSIDLCVDVNKYPVGTDYYDRVMKPLLNSDKKIIYIGEINSEHKKQWYQYAKATLFPIQWGEPFGLVPVESMACGTPVIAFNRGAVPEIIVNGKTGFVVDSVDDMIEAVGLIDHIDPRECRRHVRHHFSITRMAHNYQELYHQIIDSHKMTEDSMCFSDILLSEPQNHSLIAI